MNAPATRRKGEGGQALILAVLVMAVVLGLTAMAIDLGMLFQDRRDLQNGADAATLAGVAYLPQNPATAMQEARDWAAKNGFDNSQITVVEVRSTYVPNDTLYVELDGDFNWIFGRVLGMTTSNVGADATAIVGTLGGNNKMMPWALLQGDSGCLDASGDAVFGGSCTVKVGAGASAINGWYGALDFDGNGGGSAEYKANIIDGTTNWRYCVSGDSSPGCVSAVTVIDTLTGNKVGPTDQGIDERTATPSCDGDSSGKDDFDEVFTATGGDPPYTVSCPDSGRLIIIPIVSYTGTPPVHTVTIEGWSLAYLDSYACVGNCSGNGHWEVSIQVVDAAYSQAAGFLGAYNDEFGITIRKLID